MKTARHHSVLLDNVHSLIGRKAKKDKAPLIQEFSRLLFKILLHRIWKVEMIVICMVLH